MNQGSFILPSVHVVDPRSPVHGQAVDLLITDGQVRAVSEPGSLTGAPSIDWAKGCCISPGWVDGRARSGAPGHEERETYVSLAQSALAGGFTHVALMPSTVPVRDNRPSIEALPQMDHVAWIPVGALTQGIHGEKLAELADMRAAGALAFSDDKNPIDRPHTLQLALEYAHGLEARVWSFPFERSICPTGVAHEGVSALKSGMAPIPVLAETLRVQRDLAIAEYAGGGLHLSGISSAESVALIRAAKAQGIDVTADVAVANLVGQDSDIESYDTAVKLLPPLRSAQDQAALWEGLLDGTIDLVVSDHDPMDHELKACEWGSANFGAATIEDAFAWFHAARGDRPSLDSWIAAVAHRAREVFGLGPVTVNTGSPADFTLFELDQVREEHFSLGVNVPNWKKRGRAVGVVLGDQAFACGESGAQH
ncbi:MAG: dihydroorotase [Schleiferiaceae bacterium]